MSYWLISILMMMIIIIFFFLFSFAFCIRSRCSSFFFHSLLSVAYCSLYPLTDMTHWYISSIFSLTYLRSSSNHLHSTHSFPISRHRMTSFSRFFHSLSPLPFLPLPTFSRGLFYWPGLTDIHMYMYIMTGLTTNSKILVLILLLTLLWHNITYRALILSCPIEITCNVCNSATQPNIPHSPSCGGHQYIMINQSNAKNVPANK